MNSWAPVLKCKSNLVVSKLLNATSGRSNLTFDLFGHTLPWCLFKLYCRDVLCFNGTACLVYVLDVFIRLIGQSNFPLEQ